MLHPQRASENTTFSIQNSIASTSPTEANELVSKIETEGEDVWTEWPYCWAIDLYEIARERFHSFHQNLNDWKLARFNRRAQAAFRAQFWQQWQRDGEEEVLELRLV